MILRVALFLKFSAALRSVSGYALCTLLHNFLHLVQTSGFGIQNTFQLYPSGFKSRLLADQKNSRQWEMTWFRNLNLSYRQNL